MILLNLQSVPSAIIRRKSVVIFFLFLFLTAALIAQVQFSSFSLNAQNDLLFSLQTKKGNGAAYESLFLKRQNSDHFIPLTFYPERIEAAQNGHVLLLSNDLGAVALNLEDGKKSVLKNFSRFDFSDLNQNFESFQVSPLGRYVSYVEPQNYVFGRLILLDLKTNKKLFVSENVLQNTQAICWAEDESSFLFETADALFFTRPSWLLPPAAASQNADSKKFTGTQVASTGLRAVHWIDKNTFCLVEGSSVYKINVNQLFTSSLYENILSVKQQMTRLPFPFLPETDELFFNADGTACIILKDGRNIYFWDFSKSTGSAASASIPYLTLKNRPFCFCVFWYGVGNSLPVVAYQKSPESKQEVWKVSNGVFVSWPLARGEKLAAVNSKYALYEAANGIVVKSLASATTVFSVSGEKLISACWLDDAVLVLATDSELLKVDVRKRTKSVLLFSQLADFSWGQNGEILAKTRAPFEMRRNVGGLFWTDTATPRLPPKKTYNENYRVYVDKSSGFFRSMIFFRSTRNLGTTPLVKNFEQIKAGKKQTVKKTKRAALVFDALDNTDGLLSVLSVLQKHHVSATFFLTSEAIHSSPDCVREIVKAGYPCGSLFIAPVNLSNQKFTITRDFIEKGLARAEDVFYKATGAEFTLYWHTPYYVTSSKVISLAKAAGYEFVLPTITIADWTNAHNSGNIPEVPQNSYTIINYILENIDDKAIIPIQIGSIENKTDYLYAKLDLLLRLLEANGYRVVDLKEVL